MKIKRTIRHVLTHLVIIVLGLVMIYPIVWMIVSSFKPNNMIFSDPGLIPKAVTFENYVSGWKGYAGVSFGRFFANSLLMCASAVIGNLISCTMAAYAFARLKFVGKNFFFAVMMVTLMLPAHVTIVPRYILFNTFGWVGTLLPIVVPKFLAVDAEQHDHRLVAVVGELDRGTMLGRTALAGGPPDVDVLRDETDLIQLPQKRLVKNHTRSSSTSQLLPNIGQ